MFANFYACLFDSQMAEYRISIYGRKQSEWDQLASWIVNNELYSQNVVWLIQVFSGYLLVSVALIFICINHYSSEARVLRKW